MAAYRIDDVLPKIRARLETRFGRTYSAEEILEVTLAAYNAIDIGIEADGSIVHAAPKSLDFPAQRNVRWSGGRRR